MILDTEKLKQLRERRGWSQDQLATAAGVSVRTVQRAEKDGTASRETKVCLAAALDVPHVDLEATDQAPISAASPGAVLNVSAKTKAIFQRAEATGIGMAIGTFLYMAATRGIVAETWFKSAFMGPGVFATYATLRRLMRKPEQTSDPVL